MDQPSVDGFNTFLVSSLAADSGFPVALSGLGGDEVLGGYGYYRRLRQLHLAAPIWRRLPSRARHASAATVGARFSRSGELVAGILEATTMGEVHRAWRSLFSPAEVGRLTGADATWGLRWATDASEAEGRQLRRLDTTTYLRPILLRDTDVFSMANGVEVRVPFLDDAFVATALGGQGGKGSGRTDRAGAGVTSKADLAAALGDPWLAGLARVPKLAFTLPWTKWLAEGAMLGHTLGGEDPWAGHVDPVEARRIVASEPARRNPLRHWALVTLAGWLARPPADRHLAPRRLG